MARNVPGMPLWPALMSSATGVVLAIVLLAHRRRPTIRLSMAVFMLNNAVILVALWITSGAYAAAPGRWIPFQANKLGALAAAVLSPDLVSGIARDRRLRRDGGAAHFTFRPRSNSGSRSASRG